MGEASSVLRSVVVGLRMGRRHAQVMDELPEYQVVGVCDLNATRAAEVASKLPDSKAYTDYEKMLAAEKPTDRDVRIGAYALYDPTSTAAGSFPAAYDDRLISQRLSEPT